MISIVLSSIFILNVHGTASPLPDGCDIDYALDVVLLVDQSCQMESAVCVDYLDGIFVYIASIKKYSEPRIAYIDMSSSIPNPFISLANTDFNDLTDPTKFLTTINAMESTITSQDCNEGMLLLPDIQDSINKAITELNAHSTTVRDKRIIIISNCKDNSYPDVCSTFEPEIEFEIIVVNIANPTPLIPSQISNSERDTYLKCLTENDIWSTRLLSATSPATSDMIYVAYDLWDQICNDTTEAATTEHLTTIEPVTTDATTTEQITTGSTTTTTGSTTDEKTTTQPTVVCGDNKNSGPGREIQCTSDEDCCDGFSCRTKDGPKKGKCGRDKKKTRKNRDSSRHFSHDKKRRYSSQKHDSSSGELSERNNALTNDEQQSMSSASVGNNGDKNNISWLLLFVGI